MTLRRGLAPALAVLTLAGAARADELAAVVTGSPAAEVVVVGASGQLWERGAGGDWLRARAGGVAADVQGGVWADGVVVVGKGAPPYRFDGATWQAIRLGERGRTTAGAGPAATVAIGRTTFLWQRGAWVRLGTASAPVVAVWAASESRGFIAAGGKLWRPVRKRLALYAAVDVTRFGAGQAPWAITAAAELYDVTRRAVVPVTPGGVALAPQLVAVAPDGEPWVLGVRADAPVMARRSGGWVEVPAPPLAVDDEVVGWVVGQAGTSTLVTRQGGVWLRDATGAWTAGTRRDALPSAPPGPGPARTP
ncbi:MAG: hypothetical protein R3B06_09985 [Kofleriaceae bacterium]